MRAFIWSETLASRLECDESLSSWLMSNRLLADFPDPVIPLDREVLSMKATNQGVVIRVRTE